jgi:hypothetical protein
MGLGMVVHTYNPSYFGGKDQEDYTSKAGEAKVSISINKSGEVFHTCNLSYTGMEVGGLQSKAGSRQKLKTVSEKIK